jgi:hypothetical protein
VCVAFGRAYRWAVLRCRVEAQCGKLALLARQRRLFAPAFHAAATAQQRHRPKQSDRDGAACLVSWASERFVSVERGDCFAHREHASAAAMYSPQCTCARASAAAEAEGGGCVSEHPKT